MALTVAAFESAWSTTTTPKDVVVTGCVVGDWLAVVAGGDQAISNGVTAATTTVQAGPGAGTVTELVEDFDSGTSADWYHAAKIEVTGSGDITVRVDRTKAGVSGGQWGFLVIRGREAGAPVLLGQQGANGSGQTITGAVGQESAVVSAFFDWNATTGPTAWTPAGQTVIESSVNTSYSLGAAYWTGQAAGTRAYGSTNFTSSALKGLAVEIPEVLAGPPPSLMFLSPIRSGL